MQEPRVAFKTFLSIRNWVLFSLMIRDHFPLATALALPFQAANLEAGTITLPRRVVILTRETQTILVDYCRQFAARLRPDGPLFPTRTGKCVDRSGFRKYVILPALGHIAPDFKLKALHPGKLPAAVQERLLANPLVSRSFNSRDTLICKLELWLGLRPEEFSRIRKCDIEFGHGLIVLRDTKSGGDQEVPIPTPLVDELKAFIEPLNSDELVFRKLGGQAVHRRQIELVVRAWGEHKGVKAVTPQLVRRSLATVLEDRGAAPAQIESLLRHAGTSILRRHYSRPSLQRARAALEFHPFNDLH